MPLGSSLTAAVACREAHVAGVGGGTGVGMIEVYEVPG
jgi:hypothetical protein